MCKFSVLKYRKSVLILFKENGNITSAGAYLSISKVNMRVWRNWQTRQI